MIRTTDTPSLLLAATVATTAPRAVAEETSVRRIFFIAGAGVRSNSNIATFEDEMRRPGYIDGSNTGSAPGVHTSIVRQII